MKKVVAVMVAMFLIIAWPGCEIWAMLFRSILGGGVEQEYIYPLYAGIILLSGIVVGCTVVIVKEIRSLKTEMNQEQ